MQDYFELKFIGFVILSTALFLLVIFLPEAL